MLNRPLLCAIFLLGVNAIPTIALSEDIKFYTPPSSLFDEPEAAPVVPTAPAPAKQKMVAPKPTSKPIPNQSFKETPEPSKPSPKASVVTGEPMKAIKAEKVEAQPLEPVKPSPNDKGAKSNTLILGFQGERITLSQTHISQLEANADEYRKLPSDQLVYIHAYAQSNGSDGAGKARSYSLSRALSVRDWLIEKGIKAKRIKIRALGSLSSDILIESSQIPQDRVEVFVGPL